MKWIVFFIALSGVYPLALLLRRNPQLQIAAWTMLGLLPFVGLGMLDVNFLSFETYRGDSRGFEVTIVDLLALSLYACTPKPAKRSPYLVARSIYFLAALASVTQAEEPLFSWFSIWKLVRMYFLLIVVSRGCRSERALHALLAGMSLGVACQGLMVIYQRYFLGMHQVRGFFAHQNSLGMAINLVAPVCLVRVLARSNDRISLLALLASPIAIVMTLSRGAMAAFVGAMSLATGLSVARAVTTRKLLVSVLAILLGGVMLGKAADTILERFSTASPRSRIDRAIFTSASAAMLLDHPMGIGINQFSLVVNKNGYWRRAAEPFGEQVSDGAGRGSRDSGYGGIVHNIYWLNAAELGYLGIVGFTWLVVAPLWHAFTAAWRARTDPRAELLVGLGAGLLALHVSGFLEWAMRQTSISYLFWMVIAMIATLNSQTRSRQASLAAVRDKRRTATQPRRTNLSRAWSRSRNVAGGFRIPLAAERKPRRKGESHVNRIGARARPRLRHWLLPLLGPLACHPTANAQTLLELRTADPSVIAAIVQTGPHEPSDPARLELLPSRWTVDGVPPLGLHRYSVPWDETPDLRATVRHRVYLELPEPLDQNREYVVRTPYGSGTLLFDERKTFCEAIKVNQVGYHRDSTSRFANFGVYLGDGGSRIFDPPPTYVVIREHDGKVMTWGTGRYMGDDTAVSKKSVTSGEHVYRLSLDEIPEGGPYHVVVEGCGRSRSFGVGMLYSRKIARVAARGLYHQRCGTALERPYTEYTRGACHPEVVDTRATWTPGSKIDVPNDGTPKFSISGGHHDAGDYDRRPQHLLIPILMMGYLEAFPDHFIDAQYDIPESGNGIPDFLDEAMWSILGWEHLQVTDPEDSDYGGVRQGTEARKEPEYGRANAVTDPLVYGTFGVGVESTALSAGIFAQASRLIAPYDQTRSEELLARARLAWSWLVKHVDVRASETKFMYAALQLYLATGEDRFHELFKSAIDVIMFSVHKWPEQCLPGNQEAKCKIAHVVSYMLTDRPTDKRTVERFMRKLYSMAERGTYMGPPPEDHPYPQGVTKFMGWGAATAQGRYADLYCFAYRFSDDPKTRQRYFNAASQYGDFALGLNPLGMSFVTGLGTDQPVSPTHLDSYYTKYGVADGGSDGHGGRPKGNVPGILIFGPSSDRSGVSWQAAVNAKLFPSWYALPQLRRWADGWSLVPNNEFSVWETLVWNAVLHGCLYDASADEPVDPEPTPGSDTKQDERLADLRRLGIPWAASGSSRLPERLQVVPE